jgi:hypothetical protein
MPFTEQKVQEIPDVRTGIRRQNRFKPSLALNKADLTVVKISLQSRIGRQPILDTV